MLTENWIDELQQFKFKFHSILLVMSNGGHKRGYDKEIKNIFGSQISEFIYNVPAMPDLEYVRSLYKTVRGKKFDCIIAIGGGSVIDISKTLKIILNLKTNFEYSSKFFDGDIDLDLTLPNIIAIPTTAGSGSEMTHFATLWDQKDLKKKSVSNQCLKPNYAILDHNFLKSLSIDNLIFPAFDSISHACESIWNKNANQISKKYARSSLRFSLMAFEHILASQSENKYEAETYRNLLLASTSSGKAIEITRTAISHSISYPLTLNYNIPHGLAAVFTIPTIFSLKRNELQFESEDVVLFELISVVLSRFNLGKRIRSYADKSQLLNLINQMQTRNRSDNFIVDLFKPDLIQIVSLSLD